MQEEHKYQIVELTPNISGLLNYNHFKEKCIEYEIVTETMVYNLEKINYSGDTRFIALLNKIIVRGPDAYRKLINVLLHSSQELLTILINLQKQL